MKLIYTKLIVGVIAGIIICTPFWQWSMPLIVWIVLYKKEPRPSIMSTTDPYV